MSLRALLLTLGGFAVVLAGCGGDGRTDSGSASRDATARPQDFPKGSSLSFDEVRTRYPADLSLGIGASVMRQGTNRIPFLILDKGARPVRNAAVALYTVRTDGTGVRGPYAARETPFGIKPRYRSKTSAADADLGQAFYVANVRFHGPAPQGVFALARMDGRLVATSPTPLGVKGRRSTTPPDVGAQAISVHTQTVNDVKKVSDITTRVPPDSDMLRADLADVLGRKPVVLVFATPALCQSRVCGPVVDVAEQVHAELGNKVAFIHQEIYRDNQVDKGLRPQLLSWRLASEPWTFVIDRNGRIADRLEGAISVPELRAVVQKTLAG